jgi:hypothetical protein
MFWWFVHGQNVGIGTALPAERLHVAGNLRFDGALMPNGNPGTSGQYLMSQGAGSPPIWTSLALSQQCTTTYTTSTYTFTGTLTVIPGLALTINVPTDGTYDLFIQSDGGVRFASCGITTGNTSQVAVGLRYDGNIVRAVSIMGSKPANFADFVDNWNITSVVQSVPAGPHTIQVEGMNFGGACGSITTGDPNPAGFFRGELHVCLIRR